MTIRCLKQTNLTFIDNFPPDLRRGKAAPVTATGVKAWMDRLAQKMPMVLDLAPRAARCCITRHSYHALVQCAAVYWNTEPSLTIHTF